MAWKVTRHVLELGAEGQTLIPPASLCGAPSDDALHFVSCCPALEAERCALVASFTPSAGNKLPDYHVKPRYFVDIILEVHTRSVLAHSNCGELSHCAGKKEKKEGEKKYGRNIIIQMQKISM